MNLVDATVTEVIDMPYFKYEVWWRKVKYQSWGQPGQTELMFSTEEAALKCKTGFRFLT